MEIKTRTKRRRGRTPLEQSDKRTHCVSVRLNQSELDLINSKRGNMRLGEWLRCAAFDKLPPTVPEVNIKKWAELAAVSGNINQIAKHLNKNPSIDDSLITHIKKTLSEFRAALLGVSDNERNAED